MMNCSKALSTTVRAGDRPKSNRELAPQPSNIDVLCGRGRVAFEHEGNRKFRVLVAQSIPAYMGGNRRQKSLVVIKVINTVYDAGGRFLKRTGPKMQWQVAGMRTVREKVGHALRDACSNKVKCITTIHERIMSEKARLHNGDGMIAFEATENSLNPVSSGPSRAIPRRPPSSTFSSASSERRLPAGNSGSRMGNGVFTESRIPKRSLRVIVPTIGHPRETFNDQDKDVETGGTQKPRCGERYNVPSGTACSQPAVDGRFIASVTSLGEDYVVIPARLLRFESGPAAVPVSIQNSRCDVPLRFANVASQLNGRDGRTSPFLGNRPFSLVLAPTMPDDKDKTPRRLAPDST